jgi:hypothetical protein
MAFLFQIQSECFTDMGIIVNNQNLGIHHAIYHPFDCDICYFEAFVFYHIITFSASVVKENMNKFSVCSMIIINLFKNSPRFVYADSCMQSNECK